MSHLTEEQFEDILKGDTGVSEHVARCPDCRARLDEKRALARRVRGAFSSIQAGPDLVGRIRSDIAGAQVRPRIVRLHLHRHLGLGLGVAAALVIAVLSIVFYANTGSQASAAQAALVGIHHANLRSLEQPPHSQMADRPGAHAHTPAMPCAGCRGNPCTCQVRDFSGRPVTSYVVQGSNAPVSVIVVPHSPKALGMTPARSRAAAGRAVWQGACEGCNIVSVRIDGYSYCAVGQTSREELTRVLSTLPQ
jgi:anti-sigma factor RsiW